MENPALQAMRELDAASGGLLNALRNAFILRFCHLFERQFLYPVPSVMSGVILNISEEKTNACWWIFFNMEESAPNFAFLETFGLIK